MKKWLIAAAALLHANAAFAGAFTVPYEKPAFTVAVPDKWNPNHSSDGVDAASPDRSLFLSITTFETEDCASARDDALRFLSRDGMTIDRASAKESEQTIAGIQMAQTQYSATEDGKAKQIVVLVAPVPGKRCAEIAQWGAPEAFQRHAASVAKILASIKLLKK